MAQDVCIAEEEEGSALTVEDTKELIAACHVAKRSITCMPELPNGLTHRSIRVVDAIHQLHKEGGSVRVNDVARRMCSTTPSVTKLINQLCAAGMVEKHPDPCDGRVVNLSLTALGERYHRVYVDGFHDWLVLQLPGVSPEDVQTTMSTLTQLMDVLEEHHGETPGGSLAA